MTIKEIAKLTGKNKSTIGRWIEKNQLQNAIDKLQNATNQNPANFTLNETIEILRAGKISESIVSLLKENAENKNLLQLSKNNVQQQAEMIKMIIEPILDQQNKFNLKLLNEVKQISNNQKQLEYKQDYYSIIGYANMKNIKIAFSDALRLGREAAKISKLKNLEVRRIPDERFGKVGSYHITILEEIFKF